MTEFYSIKFCACLKHEISSKGPQENQACIHSCLGVHAGSQQSRQTHQTVPGPAVNSLQVQDETLNWLLHLTQN